MKTILALSLSVLALGGCGSPETTMSNQETQAFAPPKGAGRSKEAQDKIAEHMKKFNETHGGSNAPTQAQVPGQ